MIDRHAKRLTDAWLAALEQHGLVPSALHYRAQLAAFTSLLEQGLIVFQSPQEQEGITEVTLASGQVYGLRASSSCCIIYGKGADGQWHHVAAAASDLPELQRIWVDGWRTPPLLTMSLERWVELSKLASLEMQNALAEVRAQAARLAELQGDLPASSVPSERRFYEPGCGDASLPCRLCGQPLHKGAFIGWYPWHRCPERPQPTEEGT